MTNTYIYLLKDDLKNIYLLNYVILFISSLHYSSISLLKNTIYRLTYVNNYKLKNRLGLQVYNTTSEYQTYQK